jgi:hypothetical protein
LKFQTSRHTDVTGESPKGHPRKGPFSNQAIFLSGGSNNLVLEDIFTSTDRGIPAYSCDSFQKVGNALEKGQDPLLPN